MAVVYTVIRSTKAKTDVVGGCKTGSGGCAPAVINRMHQEQERAWARSHRPKPVPEYIKKQLKQDDVPLMQRLLDAGYPEEEIDHHESDLYIYVTPLTTKVIEQWCREHEYDRTWHCPTFYDQESGRLMYDCVFQFTDWWVKKAKTTL